LLRYGHLKIFKMAAGRHFEFDPNENGTVRSAFPENPTLEPNMTGIEWRVAELWPFEVRTSHIGHAVDWMTQLIFTARCTIVHSTVLRSLGVCLSVRPSVTLVDCDHIR